MIILIIPAYNEEANIASLLTKVKAFFNGKRDYTVIVVNDGSKDRTGEIVDSFHEQMPVEQAQHPTNYGVGQVFRTGFDAALEIAGEDDIIVTMEADNTSDLGILEQMIHKIEEGYDLVLASCYAPGGGVEGSNGFRIFISSAANILLKTFYPLGINTYSSFYRAYRARGLQQAYEVYGGSLIEEQGFVCMVEVLVKLSRLKLKIIEVPMVLKTDLRKGNSKMKVIRTMMGYLRFIARDMLRR